MHDARSGGAFAKVGLFSRKRLRTTRNEKSERSRRVESASASETTRRNAPGSALLRCPGTRHPAPFDGGLAQDNVDLVE